MGTTLFAEANHLRKFASNFFGSRFPVADVVRFAWFANHTTWFKPRSKNHVVPHLWRKHNLFCHCSISPSGGKSFKTNIMLKKRRNFFSQIPRSLCTKRKSLLSRASQKLLRTFRKKVLTKQTCKVCFLFFFWPYYYALICLSFFLVINWWLWLLGWGGVLVEWKEKNVLKS